MPEHDDDTSAGMEHPQNHTIQMICIISLAVAIVVDVVFNITIPILAFIPIYVRLILMGIVLFFAIVFMTKSHKALFGSAFKMEHEPKGLVKDGVFEQLRHPMYLGTLLIYLSFIVLTASIIGLITWVVILILYDRLASYEEKALLEMYAEEYDEYKAKTSKWIPR